MGREGEDVRILVFTGASEKVRLNMVKVHHENSLIKQ